jgi:hypothetical protein
MWTQIDKKGYTREIDDAHAARIAEYSGRQEGYKTGKFGCPDFDYIHIQGSPPSVPTIPLSQAGKGATNLSKRGSSRFAGRRFLKVIGLVVVLLIGLVVCALAFTPDSVVDLANQAVSATVIDKYAKTRISKLDDRYILRDYVKRKYIVLIRVDCTNDDGIPIQLQYLVGLTDDGKKVETSMNNVWECGDPPSEEEIEIVKGLIGVPLSTPKGE